MKILVTGRDGQVGWELQRTLATLGEVVATGRDQLDLANPDAIRGLVRDVKPQLIVNPAAYTAVDKAESESDAAMAINGVAPGILAEEAKRTGALLVHYSTDYVFDGSKADPYTEEDAPSPLNVYGRTKLEGERAILATGGRHLVLRTSWVYGARGRNFLLTIQRLAREREELKIVADQFGAPTWSRMIAEATAQIVARLSGPRGISSEAAPDGIFHLTSMGSTSWFGFASAILDKTELPRMPNLTPIPTTAYPLPAPRPTNSILSNDKLLRAFGISLPDWRSALALCLDKG